jgi:hypothetical protein
VRRWLLISAALLVTLFGGSLGGIALQNERRGEALVADAIALSGPRPRPIHRQPPLEGTFEQCAVRVVDQAIDGGTMAGHLGTFSGVAPKDVADPIRSVLDGGAPYESLSESTRATHQMLTGWAQGLTSCTRAPVLEAMEGLGPLTDWNHPRDQLPLFVQSAGKVEMLSARHEFEAGAPDLAVARCGDLLALARDVELEKGLIGAMVATSVTKTMLPTCGTALGLASPEARQRFLEALASVRKTHLSFGQVLQIERIQMQVVLFSKYLTREQYARLPRGALRLAQVNGVDPPRLKAIALWFYWGEYVASLDALIEASGAPDRDARFKALQDKTGLLEEYAVGGMMGGDWGKFARRHDDIARGFDLLESAARGATPVGSVTSTRDGDATLLTIDWFDGEKLSVRVPSP